MSIAACFYRLSEAGLFYSGCKVHGTSIVLTNDDLDGMDGVVSPPPPTMGTSGRGGGVIDDLDLDAEDIDESDVPNETTAFNPSGLTNNNNNHMVSHSSNATIVSNGSNHRLLHDSSSAAKAGARRGVVGGGVNRVNGVNNPAASAAHHLIRPFRDATVTSDDDDDDDSARGDGGGRQAAPPYDHSNCSNNLHKSCACVSFIAEHTKAREEATKVRNTLP